MSSDLQDNLVTGSESLVHVQKDDIPAGDLLDFSTDNFAEPTSTTEETNEGVEDIPDAGIKGSESEQSSIESNEKKESEVETATTTTNEEVGNSTVTTTVNSTDVSVANNESELQLKSPLGIFLIDQKVSPLALKVIYWNNVYKSAGIFGGALFLLLSMYSYTILSVITNFGMAVLAVAFLYRIGMTIVNAVQKTSAEHPFKNLLEEKVEVSEEMMNKVANFVRGEINCTIRTLQKLFLVEDVFQSLKFGVTLWLISYIGSWFSPLTVAILFLIIVFTIPRLYEEKQDQIDQVFVLISEKMKESYAQVESKIPEKVLVFIKKDKKD